MASHFREEEKPKRSGGKALIIILCIIAALAVIGAGVFFGSHFLMQPKIEPIATEATQAIVTEAPIFVKKEVLDAEYASKARGDREMLSLNSLPTSILKEAMDMAVKSENYELAAQLRNEINMRK